MNELGMAIRDIRRRKDKVQGDLAKALDMPLSTYSLKEREGDFTESEIESLLRILEITKAELYRTIETIRATTKKTPDQIDRDKLINTLAGLIADEGSVKSNLEKMLKGQDRIEASIRDLTKAVDALRSSIGVQNNKHKQTDGAK